MDSQTKSSEQKPFDATTETVGSNQEPESNVLDNTPSGLIPSENSPQSFPSEYSSLNMTTTTPEPPPPPLASDTPTIVVAKDGGGTPKWFYLVFALVVVLFIAITTLLVMSLKQRETTSVTVPSPTVLIPSPTVISLPTIKISPTITVPIQASDSALLKLNQLSGSDEIKDIEADLNSTDFSSLNQSLTILDEQLGSTSEAKE